MPTYVNGNETGLLIETCAGSYLSGTDDDSYLIEKNMQFMNTIALQVYEKGHLPVLGEWYALPLLKETGSNSIGDEIFNRIFHPSSIRLVDHCDAVLRVGGPSQGADEMVKYALENGKKVYYTLDEIPTVHSY